MTPIFDVHSDASRRSQDSIRVRSGSRRGQSWSALAFRAAALLAAVCALLFTTTGAFAQKVVRVWHTETDARSVAAMSAIAKRFEARHPDVKIQAEALGWNDLEDRIMQALAAGTPPELSHGQPITCTALQSKGLLLPLTEVVTAIGEADLLDIAKRMCRAGKDYYGVPHAAATSLLVYRKDLALARGLKQPSTWVELLANAKALTIDKDGDGKPDIYGVSLPGDNLFINIILGELVAANGGRLFDEGMQPQLVQPQVLQALAFFRDLARYAPPGWENHTYRQTFANLYQQRAAMMLFALGRGASMIEEFAPTAIANTGAFDVWVKPQGPTGSASASQLDAEPWMLFKGSRHPKEAIAFLKHFFQRENYIEYVQAMPIQLLPVTRSLRLDKHYQATPMLARWRSWVDVQERYLDRGQAKPALVIEWNDMQRKPFLLDILNSGILRDLVMQVALDNVTPERAATLAQRRIEDLLRMRGYVK